MQKLKLFIIILIILIFSLFISMEIRDYGNGNFIGSFLITLAFGFGCVIVLTVYYIGAKTAFIRNNTGSEKNYANPLDIWMLSIPMCVLMVIAYTLLNWYSAEVFFCTMLSLSGMFFANNLGRGSGKWRMSKSFPFFIGCIITIAYGIIIGGMK